MNNLESQELPVYASLVSNVYTEELPSKAESVLVNNKIKTSSKTGSKKKKEATILVVDDDAEMCKVLKLLLEEKYSIITACNGIDALKKINKNHPDLIVTDILMPEMNGIRFLKELKQNFQTSRIPVIAVSVCKEEKEKMNGYAAGADDYLLKPFSKNELLARICYQLKVAKVRNEAEMKMRNIFTQSPVAILILNGPDYIVELANDLYLQIVEKGKDFIGKPLFASLPIFQAQGIKELLDNVMQTGTPFYGREMEFQLFRNDKRAQCFFNFVYQPIRENDIITGIMVVVTEVTEIVLARKKVEESEAFNRSVLESSPDCMKVFDAEGRLQFMNQNGQLLNDIDDFSKFKNKYWWNLWGKENRQMIKDAVIKAVKGEKSHFQTFNTTAKGIPKWWDVIVLPIEKNGEDNKRIISVSRDITEQKKSAIKIEESEHHYHELIHSSTSLISILRGEDMIITIANDAIIEIWGKGKDVIGKPYFEVLPELLEQGFAERLQHVYTTGIQFRANEMPVTLLRDGKTELKYYEFILQPQRNINKEIEGVAIIGIEVTPKAEVNLKLKESEERFRSLADNIPLIAFIIEPNPEATISYWNKTWLDYTGQTLEETIDKAWYGTIHPDDLPGVMEIYIPALEKREPYFLPGIRVKRYDGQYRWHSVKSNPRYMPDGEFMGYIGVGSDIHESKLAVDSLKESEQRFRNLVEKASSPICILKGEDMILEVANEPVFKIWNVGKEAIGKPFLEIIPEMKGQPFMGWLLDVFRNGVTHYGYEESAYFTRENGEKETVYFNFVYQPYRENDGTISGVMVLATDVTEQLLARKKIEDSEKRYYKMLMQSPLGFSVMKGKDMKITLANDLIKEFWGKGNDVEGKTLLELLPELADQPFPAMLDKVYTSGIPVHENEILAQLTHNGKLEDHYFNVVYQPHYEEDETVSGVITNAYEVTEMVLSRKKMEAQALMVQNLLMNAPGFVCTMSGPSHVYQLVNEKYQQLFGKRKIQGKPMLEALPELAGQGFDTLLDNVYYTGETYVGIDIPITLARDENLAPEIRYFNFSYQPMYNENNNIYSILVFGYEVTAQMNAKNAVAESEEKYRLMADLMPVKVTNADAEGNINYYNKSWLNYSGLNIEELQDNGWGKLIHPDDVEKVTQLWQQTIKTGNDLEMEFRCLNKDGKYLWHLSRAKAIKDENGKIKLWIGTTTEIQKMKDEITQKQNFLAMVSHEVRTPITSIKAYIQLMISMLKEEHEAALAPLPIKSSLIRVDKLVSRLNRLIDEMLDMSRLESGRLELNKSLFNPNELLTDVIKDIQFTHREQVIHLAHEFNCTINGDKDRIEQVIINLVNNAMKYSENGESIDIRIYEAPNKHIAISVKDQGIGIDKKEQQKIFERFYRVGGTSEHTYPGFGIGLFIANEIVKRHNGFITIKSEKGKGSIFTFTIPCNGSLAK